MKALIVPPLMAAALVVAGGVALARMTPVAVVHELPLVKPAYAVVQDVALPIY